MYLYSVKPYADVYIVHEQHHLIFYTYIYTYIYIHICIHIAFVPYLQLLQLAAAVEKRGSDGVLWRAGTQLRASSQTL